VIVGAEVMPELLYPDDIDDRLNWPAGTARRMARRGRLPHVLLPDNEIRFIWEEIAPLIRRVPIREQQGVRQ
jgi:hypothetical protein